MNLTIDDITVSQLLDFCQRGREKDLAECYYADNKGFFSSTLNSLMNTKCMYDKDTGEVYAIGGFETGFVWMLCTDSVERHPIAFLNFTKEELKNVLNKYGWLANYVWLGNPLHVKWLKWMGAQFYQTVDINGQPFQYFEFGNKKE